MKPSLVIYLLKSSDETNSKDKYVEYIENVKSSNFIINQIKLINLLEFKFINLTKFEEKLNEFFNQKITKYSCLIISSRQIIEAMKLVKLNIELDPNFIRRYCIYCVGEQTSAQLKSFLFTKYSILSNLVDIKIPSTKQNANELANLIVNENKLNFNAFFPCSSIRKDDLIIKLKEADLNIDELLVYETVTSENGINTLITILKENNKVQSTITNCFVLFSPSCVQSIFEKSKELKENLYKMNPHFNWFISIGPSTSSKLSDCLNDFNQVFNHIEMSEPSPRGVVEALDTISLSCLKA